MFLIWATKYRQPLNIQTLRLVKQINVLWHFGWINMIYKQNTLNYLLQIMKIVYIH